MDCVDYNMWCSLIEFLEANLPSTLQGISDMPSKIQVLPSYPKHLMKFTKPSVIVQKIYATAEDIGMGGVLGQHTNDLHETRDVIGKVHSVMYQMTVEGDSNYQASVLTSAIVAILHSNTEGAYSTATRIPLKDHTQSLKPVIGNMTRYGNVDITPLSVDEDKDYAVSIRATFNVVQAIIDTEQQLVDFRKPIKWVIKLNTGRK